MHDMRDYNRNQNHSSVHHQHEQFETAAPGQVEIAADIASGNEFQIQGHEDHAEANFSQQQRGLLSEIASKPAQALEAQQPFLILEATAQTTRRNTHQEKVLSQCCHHHHESPKNFHNLMQS